MDEEREQQPAGYAEDTAEELLEQAQSNGQAIIIATIAFLADRKIPIADWTASLGRTFALAWDEPEPWDAGEFLDAMLTNLRALGAQVNAAELGVDRAEATTTGFPDPELCVLFGVDPSHATVFHDAAAAIAAPRGLRWTWQTEPGGITHFFVERVGEG